jgi:hypothetical protein
MWGMPYLSFVPLWLVTMMPKEPCGTKLRRFGTTWGVLFILTLLAYPGSHLSAGWVGLSVPRTRFPGLELSRKARELWVQKTGRPLEIVMGKTWIAGNVAFYAPDFHNRPHTCLNGKLEYSPWLSEDDIKRKGALVLWQDDHQLAPEVRSSYGVKESGPPLELTVQTWPEPRTVRIHWGLIMPAAMMEATSQDEPLQ